MGERQPYAWVNGEPQYHEGEQPSPEPDPDPSAAASAEVMRGARVLIFAIGLAIMGGMSAMAYYGDGPRDSDANPPVDEHGVYTYVIEDVKPTIVYLREDNDAGKVDTMVVDRTDKRLNYAYLRDHVGKRERVYWEARGGSTYVVHAEDPAAVDDVAEPPTAP